MEYTKLSVPFILNTVNTDTGIRVGSAHKEEVHRDRKKLCCLLSLRILYDVKRPRVENYQLWMAKHHSVV